MAWLPATPTSSSSWSSRRRRDWSPTGVWPGGWDRDGRHRVRLPLGHAATGGPLRARPGRRTRRRSPWRRRGKTRRGPGHRRASDATQGRGAQTGARGFLIDRRQVHWSGESCGCCIAGRRPRHEPGAGRRAAPFYMSRAFNFARQQRLHSLHSFAEFHHIGERGQLVPPTVMAPLSRLEREAAHCSLEHGQSGASGVALCRQFSTGTAWLVAHARRRVRSMPLHCFMGGCDFSDGHHKSCCIPVRTPSRPSTSVP